MEATLNKKLYDYFAKYGTGYSEYCTEFITSNMHQYLESGEPVDVITQVAFAIGEKPKVGRSPYDSFFDYLKEKHDLGRDILEVSCGKYPALSVMVDKYQQEIKEGSITAYDPQLVTTKLGNIKLHRSFFNMDTDVSKYSLLMGFFPCSSTIDIIKKSNEEDKDFVIGLCGCMHNTDDIDFPFELTYDRWVDHIYHQAYTSARCGRKVDLEHVKGLRYPVISSVRK